LEPIWLDDLTMLVEVINYLRALSFVGSAMNMGHSVRQHWTKGATKLTTQTASFAEQSIA